MKLICLESFSDMRRSSLNGGLLIKQEHAMTSEHLHLMRDSEVHHIIKREVPVEYDDMEQEPQVGGMAEDLTVQGQDHHSHYHHHHHQHNNSNILDSA